MKYQKNFDSVKKAIEARGFQCLELNPEDPHLEVTIKNDPIGYAWKAFLYLTFQQLSYLEKEKKEGFLQIFVPFPFGCAPENVQTLARLLLLLNKSFPFPAFGLSETDGVIYYRHLLYCKSKVIPDMLVCSILEILRLYIDSLSPMIEMVASGKKQLQEVLEEALRL